MLRNVTNFRFGEVNNWGLNRPRNTMRKFNIIVIALSAFLMGGCSNLRGAKLLTPEHFGLIKIDQNIYIEAGANEKAKAKLREATSMAESILRAAYGSVTSHPSIHACIEGFSRFDCRSFYLTSLFRRFG